MKKQLINLLIFATLMTCLIIAFIQTKNIFIYFIILIMIMLFTYINIRMYYLKKREQSYIREKLEIAKVNVFNVENVILLIIRDNKVVWGNDVAYEEFPNLYNDRSFNFLVENEENDILKFNNKVYHILQKGEIYFLINITKEYRERNKLQDLQTVIGTFQIDNLDGIRQMLDTVKFNEFYLEFRKDLLDIFIRNDIFFQEIDDDEFYLNIPYPYIQKGIENRFEDIGELINKYQSKDIIVTTSMGVAYNYNTIFENGEKSKEALDLAVSRGGAQIVLFNNEEKLYFGGGLGNSQDSMKIRARIIGNTLDRVASQRDVIYVVTHKNPDSDAIASELLMYNFLKKKNNEVRLIVDSEEAYEKYKLGDLEFANDIVTSVVVDKTKKNVLVALDTQSIDIVSHPHLIEEIEDVIIIDHHQTPNKYFRGNLFSWIESTASSTVEMIMAILSMAGQVNKNERINDLGIRGILTDTNQLKYRVSGRTFDALMNLVDSGGNFKEVLESLYVSKTTFKEKQQILNKVKFQDKYAIMDLDYEVEEILMSMSVDEALEIQGIAVSIIFSKIDEDRYRLKIRSNGEINAKLLIEKYEGGGHAMQAAGFVTEEQKQEILNEISKEEE